MLCFVFSALIVALDQFIKHWVIRTLEVGETGPELITGVIGLTRWENDGAMLNILSGQQWLLAGIAFAAALVLIMILLRYNEGFWGTLGLAAVLGGTVGNLVDRIFNEGKVIDMFRTLFINFPIFNIADIFITLGFLTFLIHFIAISFSAGRDEEDDEEEYEDDEEYDEEYEGEYEEFPEIDAIVAAQAEEEFSASSGRNVPGSQYEPYASEKQNTSETQYTSEPQYGSYAPESQYDSYSPEPQYTPESQYSSVPMFSPEDVMPMSSDYEPVTDSTPDSMFTLDALEAELESMDDYNVDDLLREYGFEDDDKL